MKEIRVNRLFVAEDGSEERIGLQCRGGEDVKVFGDIVIGDNVAIGANSVVNASFPEGYMTIAGAPARKVSETPSTEFIIATRSKTYG